MLQHLTRTVVFLVAITLHFSAFAAYHGKDKNLARTEKLSAPGVYQGYTEKQYKGYKYSSQYISTRDSVLLAVDVFLPKQLEKGKKVPAILYLTRYVRSIRAKFPFSLFKDPILAVVPEDEVKFFNSFGYAVVIVDVRGSGASLGDRKMEFSPEEIADGKDIVDWIIAQPWSDGKLGTTGVSYVGTTAEMLLVNKHPAVKACIPRSNIFDLYNYIMFPGGVRMGPFIDAWGKTTQSLDQNNFLIFGGLTRLVKGIHPVQGDKNNLHYHKALANHYNNFDITKGIRKVNYRNDIHEGLGRSSEAFSIHSYRKEIEASGTAIYRIGGWYDGALMKSCLDGYVNTSNTTKVLVGPWDHGPQYNVSPFATTKKVEFDVNTEMLRFFDFHLKGIKNGIDEEAPIRFYTIGEESWKTASSWPLLQQQRQKLYLNADNTITPTLQKEGVLNYKIDYSATSGPTTRWNSITYLFMNGVSNYKDRGEEDKKLLSFTSAPFKEAVEMTGSPTIDLQWSADANDGSVFVYLEDVGPDSSVTYITEGQFRPMHRKIAENIAYKTEVPKHTYNKEDGIPYVKGENVSLNFELLPISYQIKKGHAIRVSIAGADTGHFDLTDERPTEFNITSTGILPSAIELPLVRK